MRRISFILSAICVLGYSLLAANPVFSQTAERVYIFDCGQGRAEDLSRWTPGLNVGVPVELSNNCYLIRHRGGDLIWDTGIPDSVAAKPNGIPSVNKGPAWTRSKTLEAQLLELGVQPSDVKFVAISHSHPDHVGNVELFPQSLLLVQKPEYEWRSPLGTTPFKAEHPAKTLEGDYDVFGDGSVVFDCDAGTYAWASVLARETSQHRGNPAQRRCSAFQGQLG